MLPRGNRHHLRRASWVVVVLMIPLLPTRTWGQAPIRPTPATPAPGTPARVVKSVCTAAPPVARNSLPPDQQKVYDTVAMYYKAHALWKDEGMNDVERERHQSGIDYSKPVTVVNLKCHVVEQLHPPPAEGQPPPAEGQPPANVTQGDYYAPPGSTAGELGISPEGDVVDAVNRVTAYKEKLPSRYLVIDDVMALQSTAARICDVWSMHDIGAKHDDRSRAIGFLAPGGGTQYITGYKLKIIPNSPDAWQRYCAGEHGPAPVLPPIGASAHGTVAGVPNPGVATGGANPGVATGTPTTGTPMPGTPAAGTPMPGTPAAGTPTPGTPTAGTPAPGTPTAGTPAPVTPTPVTPTPVTPTPVTPTPVTPTPVTPTPITPTPITPTPITPTPITPTPIGSTSPVAPSPIGPGMPQSINLVVLDGTAQDLVHAQYQPGSTLRLGAEVHGANQPCTPEYDLADEVAPDGGIRAWLDKDTSTIHFGARPGSGKPEATGAFSISVHCRENPQINSHGNEQPYNFETSKGRFARSNAPNPPSAVAPKPAPATPAPASMGAGSVIGGLALVGAIGLGVYALKTASAPDCKSCRCAFGGSDCTNTGDAFCTSQAGGFETRCVSTRPDCTCDSNGHPSAARIAPTSSTLGVHDVRELVALGFATHPDDVRGGNLRLPAHAGTSFGAADPDAITAFGGDAKVLFEARPPIGQYADVHDRRSSPTGSVNDRGARSSTTHVDPFKSDGVDRRPSGRVSRRPAEIDRACRPVGVATNPHLPITAPNAMMAPTRQPLAHQRSAARLRDDAGSATTAMNVALTAYSYVAGFLHPAWHPTHEPHDLGLTLIPWIQPDSGGIDVTGRF